MSGRGNADWPLAVGPYRVEAMRAEDLSRVLEIERLSFAEPWPAEAYRHEISANPRAHYAVVRALPPGAAEPSGSAGAAGSGPRGWLARMRRRTPEPQAAALRDGPPAASAIAGFAGLWLLVDEAHISTIAVHPDWRGRGLGELLLIALLGRAYTLAADCATLEVRVSNTVAQALYAKHEFAEAGRRRRYYRDNGEDAYIMTTPTLDAAYARRLAARRTALWGRMESAG
jgi:ribosomal-protein-alanine N-acetyltransferase